jgi:hypothetical protein
MKKIYWILTGLSISIVLLSLNRLTPLTSSYLQPYDFLRWLDFNAMLPIPLLSVILYYLLRKQIVYDSPFRKTAFYIFLGVLFVSGVYLFGAGSGTHEVTNYLNSRFCAAGKISSPICNIIAFNDDEFSHYVYYLGFILLNVSLMLVEFNFPRKEKVSKKDLVLVSINSLLIGLGIFANLAFEEIGLDLLFFGSVMLLALFLLFTGKKTAYRLPVIFYFAVAYTLGVVGTVVYKLIGPNL